MSHSSSNSLLQQARPTDLPPQLPDPAVAVSHAQAHWLESHERTQQQLCKSRSGDCLALEVNVDLAPASYSSSPISSTFPPIASSSTGLRYLNVEPLACPSTDHATADAPSPVSPTADNKASCASLLASAQVPAIGEAMSKDKWQPDASSALCTFPLCTANFAQSSYFFLGPRRHHCRMCGQLFCGNHSSQRALLIHTAGSARSLAQSRVCDMCVPKPGLDADEAVPELSTRKNSSTDSEPFSDYSSHSNFLRTPDDDASILMRSVHSPTHSVEVGVSVEVEEELAPIADWMDRSGVLSLYPLAVNPSHSRSKRSSSPIPSAPPLFAPSLKSRRAAKEKEIQRQTLRQRRSGKDDFWLPKWAPQSAEADEDEEEATMTVQTIGGVVEDGPFRYRPRVQTPLLTPVRA
ncbi:hypothetical protein L202_06048 [Cryptococcus amylolentus CBS 6039]|uniref:FYVE-type domain-containing protein n=1 Tax=Cryptococcus amylolentus CBS 6039 TaxID=1295533 RepID=A0A1E3HK38_9TREE|nr:hypothetical protein L202_06048 [Cryptococcus amylolentus CBS 6039]ODN76116.1 hypothetical protein L202_06048 [Cryptococcus amylolentus CBS 6039]